MLDCRLALHIIKKYEGYSEKAYPDPFTGGSPYTLGYGSQFYPDGSPVKQGQCCTKRKALEYLNHEVEVIDIQLLKLNLGLDYSMRNALISFVHSIGWEPFLYSPLIDLIEAENWGGAAEQMTRWIFDSNYKVIGGLVERRREESTLFLSEIEKKMVGKNSILLDAFRAYSGKPHEIQAICFLENNMNPYMLAEFANCFRFEGELDLNIEYPEEDSIFADWV